MFLFQDCVDLQEGITVSGGDTGKRTFSKIAQKFKNVLLQSLKHFRALSMSNCRHF